MSRAIHHWSITEERCQSSRNTKTRTLNSSPAQYTPVLNVLKEECPVDMCITPHGEKIKKVYTIAEKGKRARTSLERLSEEFEMGFDHMAKMR